MTDKTKVLYVRVTPELHDLVSAECDKQRAAHPGRNISTATVVREILYKELRAKVGPCDQHGTPCPTKSCVHREGDGAENRIDDDAEASERWFLEFGGTHEGVSAKK